MAKIRCMGCMEEFDENIQVCPNCGYERGTPAKEIYHLQPESILAGRYIIGKVLGFGGFGISYIAWDGVLEKKVAIKEYLPSDFATRMPGQTQVSVYEGEKEEQFTAGLKSFIEESQRLAKFNNVDGVVSIYDSFVENGTAYIIMEFLDGRTLKSLLKEKGKIPYTEAISYALPVLYALEEVHKSGIIHRDIAPDNIFLTKDGLVKLLDFGAARYATTLHSKSLSVILKPGYAPEEQYRTRGNQGPWSDVYAMGATLYRAITGIVPEDSLERTANDTVKEPSKLGIKLPESLENAIMNSLNVKAEDRIQSAKEFADALAGEIELERVIVKKQKDDVGKWPVWQKGLLGGAVAAVAAVAVLISTGVIKTPLTQERLPNVIKMSIEEAEAVLAPYGYKFLDEEPIAAVSDKTTDKAESASGASDKKVQTQSDASDTTDKKAQTPLSASGTSDKSTKIPNATQATTGSVSVAASEKNTEASAGESTGEVSSEIDTEAEAVENKIRIEDKIYDSAIPENMILSQSPNAGSRINLQKYPDVYITLSAGAQEVYMPEDTFVGINSKTVSQKLEELGFIVKIVEAPSNEYAPGYVMAQEFQPDTKLHMGDTITITVSTGSNGEKVAAKVPDVVGEELNEAKIAINAAKLYVVVKSEQYNDSVPKGYIIAQDPKGGTAGTTNETIVSLTVSKGKKSEAMTRVPDVVNRKLKTATETLVASGLTYSVQYAYSNAIASGTVISQSVAPDSKVKLGTNIVVTVSMGAINDSEAQIEQATKREEEILTETTRKPTPVVTTTEKPATTIDSRIKVPSVIGMEQSAAENSLSKLNVVIEKVYSSSYSSGKVVTQSINANEKVYVGTTIILRVSVGRVDDAWNITKSWPGTDAGVVEYRQKEKKQSGYYKDNWVQTGTGSNDYCNFYTQSDSSGHGENHSGSLFYSYNDKVSASNNGSTKRVITNDYENGQFYYFHWCRGRHLNAPTNSWICIGGQESCDNHYGPYYTYHAYVGSGDYSAVSGPSYLKENWSACMDSQYFYRTPVRHQEWTDYKNSQVYVYRGDWYYTGSYSSWKAANSQQNSYTPTNSSTGYDIEYRYRENHPIYD